MYFISRGRGRTCININILVDGATRWIPCSLASTVTMRSPNYIGYSVSIWAIFCGNGDSQRTLLLPFLALRVSVGRPSTMRKIESTSENRRYELKTNFPAKYPDHTTETPSLNSQRPKITAARTVYDASTLDGPNINTHNRRMH